METAEIWAEGHRSDNSDRQIPDESGGCHNGGGHHQQDVLVVDLDEATELSGCHGDADGVRLVFDGDRPAPFESIVLNVLNRPEVDLHSLELVHCCQHSEHGLSGVVLDLGFKDVATRRRFRRLVMGDSADSIVGCKDGNEVVRQVWRTDGSELVHQCAPGARSEAAPVAASSP